MTQEGTYNHDHVTNEWTDLHHVRIICEIPQLERGRRWTEFEPGFVFSTELTPGRYPAFVSYRRISVPTCKQDSDGSRFAVKKQKLWEGEWSSPVHTPSGAATTWTFVPPHLRFWALSLTHSNSTCRSTASKGEQLCATFHSGFPWGFLIEASGEDDPASTLLLGNIISEDAPAPLATAD